jgi:hypothetical protein
MIGPTISYEVFSTSHLSDPLVGLRVYKSQTLKESELEEYPENQLP